MREPFFILTSLILFSNSLLAQERNLPLNREWGLEHEKTLSATVDSVTKSTLYEPGCLKPYILNYALRKQDKSKSWIYRKVKKESLFIINDTTDKFHLTIDPLFNFEYGKDLKDISNERLYKNTRGFLAKGDIGNNFSFESSFYENQATFAQYIDTFNDTFRVVPGQGRWKRFKLNGYDYAMASGYVSYSPNKHFNFQAGHGKHFVGDGYRSLLLSDNSFNYPYARITSTFGKFQYTNLYAVLMNLNSGGVSTPPNTEPLFQKKAASFQMLSWNIHKRIQLGLFQGMIWQAADNENKQHLNFYYFNPLIYTSAIKYSTNSTNNILLGSTLKIKITNAIALYGQYVLDDYAKMGSINNKNGVQVGLKAFDLFKIKNLHFQAEYNQVKPYTYAHKKTAQNYSHYNQALAHPLGANFKETVIFLNYRTGDFFTELKFNYATIGADSSGTNYGNNIFRSDNLAFYGVNSDNNVQGQGVNRTLMYRDFKIGYLINPSTNLNIVLGISNRTENMTSMKNITNFVYVGIRTSLTNVYYDF